MEKVNVSMRAIVNGGRVEYHRWLGGPTTSNKLYEVVSSDPTNMNSTTTGLSIKETSSISPW